LVTGASGFVGRHVVRALLDRGYDVVGTHAPGHPPAAIENAARGALVPWSLDEPIVDLLRRVRPDHVYHLASPAHVPSAEQDRQRTIDHVLSASVRLLDAVRLMPSIRRVLYVSSAEVYAPPRDDRPLDEHAPQEPRSLYGVCKAAASQWLLAQAPDLVTVVRPFNQIGPGQSPLFAVASFAAQLAEIAQGKRAPELRVGNIDVERDFSDVRDTALAHVLALEKGAPGDTYNIASGKGRKLRALIDAMIARLGRPVEIAVDPARLRPGEPPHIVGDAALLMRTTGWAPTSSAEAAAVRAFEDLIN
jgi:GDP-4-dehydro-6-deoxy-D-mannose reductase